MRGGVYLIDENFYFYNDNSQHSGVLAGGSFGDMQIEGTTAEQYAQIVSYHIALNISGKNIESFDIENKSGNLLIQHLTPILKKRSIMT